MYRSIVVSILVVLTLYGCATAPKQSELKMLQKENSALQDAKDKLEQEIAMLEESLSNQRIQYQDLKAKNDELNIRLQQYKSKIKTQESGQENFVK